MDIQKPQKFTSRVSTKEQVSSKVYVAKFHLETPREILFEAGQTMMIYVAPGINRAMTIASPPQENHELTIYQDISPGGPGSQWMQHLTVGDSVQFMAPLGRFLLDADSPRKKVFVATGTGIAPFRSYLLDAGGAWKKTDTALYFGLRHEEDMFLMDELSAIDAREGQLRYYFSLSQPGASWKGLQGHVTDHVFAQEKDLIQTDFYLCGGKKMIAEMQTRLTAAGVPLSQIKNDPFY